MDYEKSHQIKIEYETEKEQEKPEWYLNVVNVITIALDSIGNITFVNKKGYEILEYEEGELLGKNWFETCLPLEEDRFRVHDYFNTLMKGETEIIKCYENAILTKNGNKKIIAWSTDFFRDNHGCITGLLSSGEDITERKEAEQKLKESEKQYKYLANEFEMILDHIPGIVVYKDAENKIIRVNKFLAEAHNLTKGEMEGISSFEIYPQDQAQAYWEDDLEVINSKKAKLNIVEPWETEKGTRWVSTSKIPHIDEAGNVNGIIAIAIDITERKLGEEKIKEQNDYLTNVIESLTHPFYVINVNDYTIEMANTAANFGDLSGDQKCFFLTHQNDKQCTGEHPCPLNIVKNTKTPVSVEHIHYDKKGNPKNIDIHGYPIFDENGEVIQMIEYAIDITEHKKVEQKLIESEAKYRHLFKSSPNAIVLINKEEIIIDCNFTTERIFGYSREELIGRNYNDLGIVTVDQISNIREKYKKILEGREVKPIEVQINSKNGDLIWINFQISSIILDGEILIVSIGQEITEKKRAEELIKEENKKLLELDQMRNDLITRISHELKTPLTSIFSCSELLLEYYNERIDNDILKFLEIIHRGGRRLNSLVVNLLDASQIDSGKLNVYKGKTNLVKIIKTIIKHIEYLAAYRNHSLNIELPEEFYLEVDEIRIKQVLTNIIANAIKNTPLNGNIDVSLKKNGNYGYITIKDTGVGLTENEMEKIFKKFGKIERYGKQLDVDIEGAGLGLYISKEIVDLHDGQIWVESEGRNKGATFIIKLPIIKNQN